MRKLNEIKFDIDLENYVILQAEQRLKELECEKSYTEIQPKGSIKQSLDEIGELVEKLKTLTIIKK